MSDSSFVASSYEPPRSAVVIGAILRAPRNVRHTGNFSHVFSPVREDQLEYVDGLMVVSGTFLIVWVLWAFTLLVLKFKGKQVGCASGRAFVTKRSEDEDDEIYQYSKDKELGDTHQDDLGSTSESSFGDYNNQPPFSEPHHKTKCQTGKIGLAATSTDPVDDDEQSSDRSRSSGWISRSYSDDHGDELRDSGHYKAPGTINLRENRTRICFVFFAIVALICVPLILVFCYGPIKQATDSSDGLVLLIREIIDNVEESLKSIEAASKSALEIVESTPTDLAKICPLVSSNEFEAKIGVDLSHIVQSIANEFDRLKEEVTTNLEIGNTIVDSIQSGVVQFEASVETTEEYMWVVPAILFAVSVLSAISILAVVMAWQEKSGIKIQRTMSWAVLPLLIMASIACWMVVVFASMSSMLGSDLCMSSSRTGSPDLTIQEIMSLHGLGTSNMLYQMVSAYTNRCIGPDPTDHIESLEKEVQAHIDNIWRQMSQIDSLGRSQVIAKCGDEVTFSDMLSGARNLAKFLTTIRRSLSSAERSLQCSVVNPMYTEVAHVTVCTSVLNSTVNGFILFLVLSTCVMAMISMRASWLRHIEEEKVYHDEDEVVENMILDEHEEYLAYISRYKHEWQEYGGFEAEGAPGSENDVYLDDESQFDDYDDFDESSDVSGLQKADGEGPTVSHVFDSTVDGATYASDDVSFASSSAQKSKDPWHVLPEGSFVTPASLLTLPPPINPQHQPHASRNVVPFHRAATTPASSSQMIDRVRSDIHNRQAFCDTSTRKSQTRSFRSTVSGGNTTVSSFNFATSEKHVDFDEGFEVQMRKE